MLGGVDRSRRIRSGVSSLEVSRYGSEGPGSIFGSLGGDGSGPGFVGFYGTCGIFVFVDFGSSPFHFSRVSGLIVWRWLGGFVFRFEGEG